MSAGVTPEQLLSTLPPHTFALLLTKDTSAAFPSTWPPMCPVQLHFWRAPEEDFMRKDTY